MTKEELLALINSEEDSAIGFHGGELSEQRTKALEYYLQQPFGNEEIGRSQAVSSDVSDVVNWLMPSLIDVFLSSDNAVSFEAVGAEDENAAKQETAYVNHVFFKQNDGFMIFYSWFWDALVQKNGIVRCDWDESETVTRETYKGLTDLELASLDADDKLEAVEHDEHEGTVVSVGEDGIPKLGPGIVHDVVYQRTEKDGKLIIQNVPPEEFLISKDANSTDLSKARFVAHRTQKTRSELIEMGFSRKIVENLSSDESSSFDQEKIARNSTNDEDYTDDTSEDSQKKIWILDAYMKVDFNDDGVSELRQVIKAGNEILTNGEVDRTPFHSITPRPIPHKFYGLSEADEVMDVMFIKSMVLRGMLDNLYLSINPEKLVNIDMVDTDGIDDLLSSRVGGLKRVSSGMNPPTHAVSALTTPFAGQEALGVMEYFDGVVKDRTGVGAEIQGLDPDTLATANTGVVNRAFEAARMQIKLVAKVFAETGVRSLFLHIHELLQKNQDKEVPFKLRNEWVDINPSEWRERTNMSVNVGLGTGNKDQELVHLSAIWDKQTALATHGKNGILVDDSKLYNTLTKMIESAGLKEVALFFVDPASEGAEKARQAQAEAAKSDPQQQFIQAQLKIEQDKALIAAEKVKLDEKKANALAEISAEEHLSKDRDRDNKHLEKMTELELEHDTDVPGSAV